MVIISVKFHTRQHSLCITYLPLRCAPHLRLAFAADDYRAQSKLTALSNYMLILGSSKLPSCAGALSLIVPLQQLHIPVDKAWWRLAHTGGCLGRPGLPGGLRSLHAIPIWINAKAVFMLSLSCQQLHLTLLCMQCCKPLNMHFTPADHVDVTIDTLLWHASTCTG